MNRYDELREAFIHYKKAEQQYVEENERLAVLIVAGLREYLGMPQSFPRREGNTTYMQSYTPLYKLDADGDTEEKKALQDALSHHSDGSFKFAFGVILEKAENAFPKHNIILHVECKRRGRNVTIDISGESMEATFDGTNCAEINDVHAMILKQILEWLKHRPGDGHGFSKIGFAIY